MLSRPVCGSSGASVSGRGWRRKHARARMVGDRVVDAHEPQVDTQLRQSVGSQSSICAMLRAISSGYGTRNP